MQTQPAEEPRRTPPVPAARPAPALDAASTIWSRSLEREHGFEALEIEGAVPPDLSGTLYRNGPVLFESFGRRYSHPFVGDGGATAVRFGGGKAEGAVRIHQTRGLVEERAAGRQLYGTEVGWARRMRNQLAGKGKNVANTNIVPWQGRLFALMEAGLPTEVDPTDLHTLGETDLGGVVRSAFSAHPHRSAARRTLFNFGLAYGKHTRLHTYALPDEGPARHLGDLPLPGPPMLHDFIATDRHLVFFVSPVRVQVARLLLQLGGFDDLFAWQPREGTEIICVPLDGGAPSRWQVPPFFQWHFANAFERGDEIVVDYVHYPDFSSFGELTTLARPGATYTALDAGRLHRAVLDPRAHTMTSEPLLDVPVEFPRVHPRVEGAAHRHVWLTAPELRGVLRHDIDTGATETAPLPAGQVGSEPVFVPRGGAEDDGWVLQLVADVTRGRSYLAILDGQRLADGPVAKAWLDQLIPVTFHGSFADV